MPFIESHHHLWDFYVVVRRRAWRPIGHALAGDHAVSCASCAQLRAKNKRYGREWWPCINYFTARTHGSLRKLKKGAILVPRQPVCVRNYEAEHMRNKKEKKNHSIRTSSRVPHNRTIPTHRSLISVFGWELMLIPEYGRDGSEWLCWLCKRGRSLCVGIFNF